MWSTRAKTAILRQARTYASTAHRVTSPPSTRATIALTAALTASACYTYSLVNEKKIVHADHYADTTIASKGVEKEVSEQPLGYKFADASTVKKVIGLLKEQLGNEKVSVTEDERLSHAQAGGTHHHPAKSDVVVYVESTEDVVKVVKLAHKYSVPVVPYSGKLRSKGTSIREM